MSDRELKRAAVLAKVADESWKLVEAAERMELSYRQAKRLWKRYLAAGAAGLVHGSTGRSNRAKDKKLRRKVIGLIRKKYSGEVGERFGPALAAEHLREEDGIEIAPETLRRWMLAEGLWSRERKSRAHRRRRERKEHFGELVQLDGSFHDWLEGRGPRGCLMNLVDDAHVVPDGRAGNDLGCGGSGDGLDGEVWSAAGAVYGLEKRVRARAHGQGTAARKVRPDAVWAHVRAVGNPDHCGQFPTSQGSCRAQPRDASRPAGEEVETQEGDDA